MASQGLILETIRPVSVAVPLNTTGAAVTSDWVSLKTFRRVAFLIQQGAWAGGTPAVTLEQATDNADTGAKALSFDAYYQSTALTDDLLVKTAVVSDTFNLPASANKLTAVEVHAQNLDVNNDFAYVRLKIASPGSNADLISVTALLGEPAYYGKQADMPSAIS